MHCHSDTVNINFKSKNKNVFSYGHKSDLHYFISKFPWEGPKEPPPLPKHIHIAKLEKLRKQNGPPYIAESEDIGFFLNENKIIET